MVLANVTASGTNNTTTYVYVHYKQATAARNLYGFVIGY